VEDARAGGSREAQVEPAKHRPLAQLHQLIRKNKKT
jgi:hypothetical protein